MARARTLIASAVAVAVVVAAGGGFYVWRSNESIRQQRELAQRVALGLSEVNPAEGDFVSGSPQQQMAQIVKELGGAKPAVTVRSVDTDAHAATLNYRWPFGKDAWTYDTTVQFEEVAGGWKARWASALVEPSLADGETLTRTVTRGVRGSILGAQGAKLAWNQPAARVGIDKTLIKDAAALEVSARSLAALLTTAKFGVDADAYAKRVASAGPKAFIEAALLRELDPAQAAVAAQAQELVGVKVVRVTRPLGLTSTFLRPILGAVTEATAEDVAASQGQVSASDLVGHGGLQAAYETSLRGELGFTIRALGGAKPRELFTVAAVNGADLQTTVDADLQRAAEATLSEVAPASALVAIRPSDGALLAVASGPGKSGVASTATQAMYPPGSTFKTVSGLALLRAGLTPTTPIPCPTSIEVGGITIANDPGYPASATGTIPWASAFAHSCNTAVVGQADKVTDAALQDAVQGLGITSAPQLVVKALLGKVPAAASDAAQHAGNLIGLGRVEMTPLGMAVVAASIAKGAPVAPALVAGGPAGPAASGTPITAAEAAQLKTLMRAVVTSGTAQSALAGTPGGELMAKTGTASVTVDRKKVARTWMIAIQGDLAVAVFVAEGESGAKTCGPLMRSFLTQVSNGRP